MTSGRVSKDTVFQKIRPWAGFKTGDFIQENFGGLPYSLMTQRFRLMCISGYRRTQTTSGGVYVAKRIIDLPTKCRKDEWTLGAVLLQQGSCHHNAFHC